jgi:hypothetical protein
MAKKKSPPRSKSGKAAATSTGSAPSSGFVFCDPQVSPDNYTNFSKAEVQADTALKAQQRLQKIPVPRKNPPVMSLSDVVSSMSLQNYKNRIVFHCVGDSGGIKEPSHQFLVADKMAEDFTQTDSEAHPAFFYNLGDVVYYFGQDKYYYEQFYDPYRDYPGPIFAIPGNHDAVVYKAEPAPSLAAFQKHFCSPAPVHSDEAMGAVRTTMTQPGVYFTLNAPLVKIIGLYSNTAEGNAEGVIADKVVGNAQLDFLIAQLQQAGKDRQNGFQGALILAVHHPPFTGSKQHVPSPAMLRDIDDACAQTKVHPDAVFSGHAHLYERYTRYKPFNGSTWQIPYVVAGTGGYPNLSGLKHKPGTAPPRVPLDSSNGDGQGNRLVLENYFGSTFGFLRVSVSTTILSCEFVGVSDQADPAKTLDRFSVDLTSHQLTGFQQP